jgi:hypothetical protein
VRSFPLDIQLDVDESAGNLADVAYGWLDGLFADMAGAERQVLSGLPARVAKPKEPFGPLGAPGEPFGVVSVERGMPPKTAERNCSSAGLRWLRGELATEPSKAAIWLGNLDERGHRSGRILTAEAAFVPTTPGWLRLHAHVDASTFLDPAEGPASQRRWLAALWSVADRVNPGFGHVSYYYYGGATALEFLLPPNRHPREQRDPDYTVGSSREFLRGYSWLTVVPQELTERLGGVAGLEKAGAFAQVRRLAAGGVWLLATEDFRDYDIGAAGKVFRALAPVLRPGLPRMRNEPFDHAPYPIVEQDAEDFQK